MDIDNTCIWAMSMSGYIFDTEIGDYHEFCGDGKNLGLV